MPIENVPIADIVLEPRLQMRAAMLFDVIDEYAEHLESLPPCRIVRGESNLWLTGGWHRYHAHKKGGSKTVPCEVRDGSFVDAIVEAAGENHGHGIRRTNEDKRRAVLALLDVPAWAEKSDRLIADACHVGHPLVSSIRKELIRSNTEKVNSTGISSSSNAENTPADPPKRTGKDGKARPATNPKKSKILCPACQHLADVGNPLIEDCEACESLQKADKKATKKKAVEKPKVNDGLPKSVSNALADTWHADCARLLAKMRTECKGAFSWSSWLDAAVLDHLKAAEDCFITAIPRKVCPECKGQKQVDKVPCNNCRQGGFMGSHS